MAETLTPAPELFSWVDDPARNDFLGFMRQGAREILPWEAMRPWLKDDIVFDELPKKPEYTRENILNVMREHMTFAWGKAHGERGISAGCSVNKFQVWVFALGDYDKIDWDDYALYGKPILRRICELYGFEVVAA